MKRRTRTSELKASPPSESAEAAPPPAKKARRPPAKPKPAAQTPAVTSWVQCDACQKWRRVSQVPTSKRWQCKNNPDIKYNKCSVQQVQLMSCTRLLALCLARTRTHQAARTRSFTVSFACLDYLCLFAAAERPPNRWRARSGSSDATQRSVGSNRRSVSPPSRCVCLCVSNEQLS